MAAYQERLRALWIIEKAQRNGEDPAKTMSLHGVSRALIEELAGSLPERGRKAKRNKEDDFYAWAAKNVDCNVTVQNLVDDFQVSLPTAYKIIREHPDCFIKNGRGAYLIRDGRADRAIAKSNKVSD
jgi:predicted DNA-binding transcriptional regulator YafY